MTLDPPDPVSVTEVSSTEFARIFSQRTRQLGWFLGSGSSASAGIPTGWDMIVEFKTRLYCAASNLGRNEVDPSDPVWLERLVTYFDGANGMPPAGDPGEYSAAFEMMFPDAADRRTFIDAAVRKGVPSFGHRVLASLVTNDLVRCLYTTNFDPLVERSTVVTDDLVDSEERAHLVVGALDSIDRATRAVGEETWPVLLKLHGDYQSVELKNTSIELQEQDMRLRQLLVDTVAGSGLVVIGYSGRDESIMDALDDAVAKPEGLPAGLWWVSRPTERPLPRVEQLLSSAAERGIKTRVVRAENFDELMGDIERELDLPVALSDHINQIRSDPIVRPVALPTTEGARFPALRCSALEVLAMPTSATEIALSESLTSTQARRVIRDADVWVTAASRGTTLVAFGSDESIDRAFGPLGGKIVGPVQLNPVHDMVDRGLLYDALTRAIARRRPLRAILRSRGHSLIVRPPDKNRSDRRASDDAAQLADLEASYQTSLVGTVPKLGRPFAETIAVRLEEWEGRWWCVFEPYTWVDLPRRPRGNEDAPADTRAFAEARGIAADWRRERWARRYNPWWNGAIGAWAKLLAPEAETELSTHHFDTPGISGDFVLSWTTAWARPNRGNTTWGAQ